MWPYRCAKFEMFFGCQRKPESAWTELSKNPPADQRCGNCSKDVAAGQNRHKGYTQKRGPRRGVTEKGHGGPGPGKGRGGSLRGQRGQSMGVAAMVATPGSAGQTGCRWGPGRPPPACKAGAAPPAPPRTARSRPRPASGWGPPRPAAMRPRRRFTASGHPRATVRVPPPPRLPTPKRPPKPRPN